MNRSLPARGAVAAAVLTAATVCVTLASAGPAGAATPTPQKTGCSSWKAVGYARMHVRECAGLSGTKLKETIYIKNSSHSAHKASGQFVVSWGQAGTGYGFTPVSVAAGHTKTVTHTFRVPAHGTFTVVAGITVSGHASPNVHTKIVH